MTNTHTTAAIYYNFLEGAKRTEPGEDVRELERAADYIAILRKWRNHCPAGLIDETGKVRHIFTRVKGVEDPVRKVSQVLEAIPEARAELDRAVAAQEALSKIGRDRVELPINNARLLDDASLDTNGFKLLSHISRVTDWDDNQQITDVYYDEMCEVATQLTGAKYAFSNNHLRRQSEPGDGGSALAKLMAQSQGPVRGAHNDFTESYGEGIINTIAADGLPHTQTFGLTEPMLEAGLTADELRESRLMVINTWRSVADEPALKSPLAIADCRTVPTTSLRRMLIGKVPSGSPRGGIEVFTAVHDPAHTWYYYPGMTRDEVLLWKGYDSAEMPLRPPLHCAFEDPATPIDAPERKSVEVRVLCVIPKD